MKGIIKLPCFDFPFGLHVIRGPYSCFARDVIAAMLKTEDFDLASLISSSTSFLFESLRSAHSRGLVPVLVPTTSPL